MLIIATRRNGKLNPNLEGLLQFSTEKQLPYELRLKLLLFLPYKLFLFDMHLNWSPKRPTVSSLEC